MNIFIFSIIVFFISAVLYTFSIYSGIVFASIFSFLLGSINPILAFSLFIFGVVIRPVSSGLPLQDGWFVILSFIAGVSIYFFKLLFKKKLKIDPLLGLFFIWSVFAGIFAIFSLEANIIRHVAVSVLVLVTALVTNSFYNGKEYFGKKISPSLFFVLISSTLTLSILFHLLIYDKGLKYYGDISLRIAEVSPRSLAVILGGLIVAAIFSYLLKDRKNIKPKYQKLFWILCLISFGGLIMTGSRVSIISTLLVLTFFLPIAFSLNKSKDIKTSLNRLFLSLIVLVAVFAIGITITYFLREVYELRAFRDFTTGRRYERWLSYFNNLTLQGSICGYGFSNYRELFWGGHPHSLYLSILIHYGFIGFFFFLAIIVRKFLQIKKYRNFCAFALLMYTVLVFMTSGHPDRPDFWALYMLITFVISNNRINLNPNQNL